MRTSQGPAEPTGEDLVAVDLPCDQQAPRQARQAARDALGRWQLPALVDRVVLVVSELVTNSVRYGRPPLRLVLTREERCVRVDVHDAFADVPPVHGRTSVTADDESGRGLLIVTAVADQVDVRQVPGDGKHVYASFST